MATLFRDGRLALNGSLGLPGFLSSDDSFPRALLNYGFLETTGFARWMWFSLSLWLLLGSLMLDGFLRLMGSLSMFGFLALLGSLTLRGFLTDFWIALFSWFSRVD